MVGPEEYVGLVHFSLLALRLLSIAMVVFVWYVRSPADCCGVESKSG
jgi:hypothetical protein